MLQIQIHSLFPFAEDTNTHAFNYLIAPLLTLQDGGILYRL
jgi:hypothetical protein